MNSGATKRISLTTVGNELALVLDQETLDALGYTSETVVHVRVEGGSIVIGPVRPEAPSSGVSLLASPRRQV